MDDNLLSLANRMKDVIDTCRDDIAKAQNGNRAAGTRVRTAMQNVKKLAQEIRQKVLEVQKTKA